MPSKLRRSLQVVRVLIVFVLLLTLVAPLSPLTTYAQVTDSSQLAAIATQLSYLQSLLQSITTGVSSLFTSPVASAQSSTITIGETTVFGGNDSGNGGLLLVQDATLSQQATIESLSFYVNTASGNLRLGIYDATGPSGGPGAKKAETASFTPTTGWNTQPVVTPVSLSPGTYWLAYLPSSSSLSFATNFSIGSFKYSTFTYGPMPTTFPTIAGQGTTHWSFYATLSTGPADLTPPTVSLTAPTSGATVSNTITVSANASDPTSPSGQSTSGMAGVQFLLDGSTSLQAEDTTSPYSISWNTTGTTNGSHTLTARARDAAGNLTTSAGVTVTVSNALDTTPPSTPSGLSASAVSSSQINLSWSASTDNVAVTGYRVERCTGATCTTFTQIATPTTNSYSDTGLTANTTYRYQVRAVDAAGNLSGYSGIVSGTTQAGGGGNTINAASCSSSAVQSAINSAGSGDTVQVPAGNCSWSGVSIPNNIKITLQGAGSANTIITGMPNIGSSGSRITGFMFLNGSTGIYGYGFRFDHNKVQSSIWTDCIKVRDYAPTISQMPWGLIDHNQFINCRVNMEGSPYIFNDDNGRNQNFLWSLPLNFGGQNTVYIEDNTFELTYVGNFNAIDANYGGSFVARYNTVYDGLFLETHSSQEGGNRSGKFFEVYGNVIDLRNNLSQSGGMSERWRGGTGLHFLNRYIGNWSNQGIPLDNVRSYAPASFGGGPCDGSSVWDGNQNSSGWPCRDQIGRGPDNPMWTLSPVGAYTQPSVPSYFWWNKNGSTEWAPYVISWSANHIQANRDYYAYTPSFTGTSGVGVGTIAVRPSACTTGTAYWATNQSYSDLTSFTGADHTQAIQGTLYKCTATNTWTVHYQPFTYPHPLAGGTPPPSDTTPPSTPTNLQATPQSSNQINLTWTASADNTAVTGYRVERCQGASCTTFAQIAQPSTTSFSDTGLTAGTTYRYQVRATDAAGNISSYSTIASATTQTGGFLQGDLNLDGTVNTLDWSLMNAVWFTADSTADINHDGIVNSIDFGLMNRNWGQTA